MDIDKMISQWQNGVRIMHMAHNICATHFNRRHVMLGVPVVIVSTIVGTAVFSTLESAPETWMQIVTGLLSITAAILAALQTFLRYGDLAEQHKIVSVRYGKLRRKLDLYTSLNKPKHDEEFLHQFRQEWDEVDVDAPQIPKKIYTECANKVISASK